MKQITPALRALFATRQFLMADLYTFTLTSGDVLRYTSADYDITANGNFFSSSGPGFGRTDISQKIGFQVDSTTVTVYPKSTDLVAGIPFLQAITRGLFDGGEVALDRAFMASKGDVSAGTINLASGRVGDIAAGRTKAVITVNSHLEILGLAWPRNIISPGCANTLFDASCGVNKAAFAVAGAAGQGSTATVLRTALPQSSGYFDRGQVFFTSGQNKGIGRPVLQQVGGIVQMSVPFPFVPAIGDAFTAYPGCDKTKGPGGCVKFNNTGRYRGFRFVPVPETAV